MPSSRRASATGPPRPTARMRRLADLIATYHRQPGRQNPEMLRAIASGVVDLRREHTLKTGAPDWGGRSAAYRQAIAEVYRMSGIPEDVRETFRVAVGYHVSNVLREVVPADQLADAGITAPPKRDRVNRTRDAVTALVEALSDPDVAASEALRMLVTAQALLERVTADAVAALAPAEAHAAGLALSAVSERADKLLPALPT